MPQGIIPLSGPPPMHYMGYYPAPYFPAQSAGDSSPTRFNFLPACCTAIWLTHHLYSLKL